MTFSVVVLNASIVTPSSCGPRAYATMFSGGIPDGPFSPACEMLIEGVTPGAVISWYGVPVWSFMASWFIMLSPL